MKQVVAISGALTAFVIGSAWSSEAHAENSFSISTGQDIGRTKFEDDARTTIKLTSLSARLRLEDWSFSISSGYADLGDDPEVVFFGPGGQEFFVAEGEPINGFTDVVLGVTTTPIDETTEAPGLTLYGSIKLPTADADAGLGSGAVDFRAAAELFKTYGDVTTYAYLGGRLRGDSDTSVSNDARLAGRFFVVEDAGTVDTRNSVEVGAGLHKPLNDRVTAGLNYDYRGAAVVGGDDAHEVTALLSAKVFKSTTLSLYGYHGFTDTSSSLGGGLLVTRRIKTW